MLRSFYWCLGSFGTAFLFVVGVTIIAAIRESRESEDDASGHEYAKVLMESAEGIKTS